VAAGRGFQERERERERDGMMLLFSFYIFATRLLSAIPLFCVAPEFVDSTFVHTHTFRR